MIYLGQLGQELMTDPIGFFLFTMEKRNIGTMFDSIAVNYDSFNHLLSAGIDRKWRKRTVASLKPCEKLLDVATGTADLAIALASSGKVSSVTGIDISKGMIEIGRQKVAKAGLENKISIVEGSALDMPFRNDSFDAVTCAYGVRNFSNLDQGLREMCRVLAPGGQLEILEFSYPSNRMVRFVYNLFFTHVMPVVGRIVCKNKSAFSYFRDSVKGFIWGRDMASRIETAGFRNVEFKTMTFGITTLYKAEK